jgi:3-dehydroquinate dehydratase-2
MKKILIINGPNLNLLHLRDKKIYGEISIDKIIDECREIAKQVNLEIDYKQSNSESEIVNFIQDAIKKYQGLIINAAAYTHTSVAIRDALEIFHGKKIELHISNIFKREDFRHNSFLSEVVDGIICGLGVEGYIIALLAMHKIIDK